MKQINLEVNVDEALVLLGYAIEGAEQSNDERFRILKNKLRDQMLAQISDEELAVL